MGKENIPKKSEEYEDYLQKEIAKKQERILKDFEKGENALLQDKNKQLTDTDKALLKEFLQAFEEHKKQEPEKLSDAVWDQIQPALLATGKVPDSYRTRIGIKEITVYDFIDDNGEYKHVPEGITQKRCYDIVWEKWNSELKKLLSKYYDLIWKVFAFAITNNTMIDEDKTMPLDKFLERFLPDPTFDSNPEYSLSFLENSFSPMYNSTITNDFMRISKNILQPPLFGLGGSATYTTPDGNKIIVEKFNELKSGLSTSAKKILNTAQIALTQINKDKANKTNINNIVEIPLYEYAEKCGERITPENMPTKEEQEKENKRADNALKDFKRQVRKDLDGIASYRESYTIKSGKNKGDYIENQRLIYKHGISKGKIIIYFDQDAAAMLVTTGGIIQQPICLLLHDNRNPNAYNIGCKIAYHNSLDNNAAAGTDSTLSVKSLLAAAPEIPTFESIQERGQRNWKEKIKTILEKNLDEQIRVGLISKWEYRDPATGKIYDPDSAQSLTWPQYYRLMVDFIMMNPPDQAERRQRKAEKKAIAAEIAGRPKRKRGRPKKEAQPSLLNEK